jgi:hypothetical protein
MAKIANIAGCNDQVVRKRSCRNQAVLQRHGETAALQVRQQPRPRPGRCRIKVQNRQTPQTLLKPFFQFPPFSSIGQKKDAIFEFTQQLVGLRSGGTILVGRFEGEGSGPADKLL